MLNTLHDVDDEEWNIFSYRNEIKSNRKVVIIYYLICDLVISVNFSKFRCIDHMKAE